MRGAQNELANATCSIRARAWGDFQRLIRSHRFSAFVIVLAAVGAGVGALAPPDASAGERFLTAAVATLGAPALAYLIALLWSFLRAPFRQRRELIAHLAGDGDRPKPLMKMEAVVETRIEKPAYEFGSAPDSHVSVAYVRVYNAQERGDEAATAKHVSVEVKVFAPGDRLVFQRKGWDTGEWRDFTTSQEEHYLWLVAKQRDSDGCFLIDEKSAQPVQRLHDDAYVAEVTLRGFLPDGPTRKRFVFSSRGSGTDLTFEEEG